MMKIIDHEGGFTLIPELAGMEITGAKERRVGHFSNIIPLREVSLVYTRRFAKAKMLDILADSIKETNPWYMLSKERGTIVEWR